METQTRFDLNAAIASWQQELAAQPGLTPTVRRELETHFRDTLSELRRLGLSGEESFWLARRRMGKTEQIGEEFAKADPRIIWRERLFWIVLALLAIELWHETTRSWFLVVKNGGMSTNLSVYLQLIVFLLNWLPIAAALLLATSGRLPLCRMALFRTPLRLAIAGYSWIAIAAFIYGMEMRPIFTNLKLVSPHADILYNLLVTAFATVMWPASLLTFLLWLMRSRAALRTKPS
jgi:hypothetical protein